MGVLLAFLFGFVQDSGIVASHSTHVIRLKVGYCLLSRGSSLNFEDVCVRPLHRYSAIKLEGFARPTSVRFKLKYIGFPLRTLGFRLATHYTFKVSGFPFLVVGSVGDALHGGSQFGFTVYHAPHV